jgi:hypothetical protein
VEQTWKVHFSPAATHLQINALPSQLLQASRQLLELYSGSADLGHIFLYSNPVLFVVFAVTCVWIMLAKPASRRLFLWAGIIVAVNVAVYVLSGSTGQDTNSRYLIMTLPAVVVAFAAVLGYSRDTLKVSLGSGMAVVCLAGCCLLVYGLIHNYDRGLSINRHYAVVDSFMVTSRYPYAYTSMNTGLPVTYLYDSNVRLLPLGCQPSSRVSLSTLFFDRAYITRVLHTSAREVPVILDQGGAITNVPSVCTQASIISQLGAPKQTVALSDTSRVLIYDTATLRQRIPLP